MVTDFCDSIWKVSRDFYDFPWFGKVCLLIWFYDFGYHKQRLSFSAISVFCHFRMLCKEISTVTPCYPSTDQLAVFKWNCNWYPHSYIFDEKLFAIKRFLRESRENVFTWNLARCFELGSSLCYSLKDYDTFTTYCH